MIGTAGTILYSCAVYSIFNHDSSVSCACTLGRQPHVALNNKIIVLKKQIERGEAETPIDLTVVYGYWCYFPSFLSGIIHQKCWSVIGEEYKHTHTHVHTHTHTYIHTHTHTHSQSSCPWLQVMVWWCMCLVCLRRSRRMKPKGSRAGRRDWLCLTGHTWVSRAGTG